MFKAIIRLILFNLPFFLISGVFFYFGFIADEKRLTDDGGMSLKNFFYLMGGSFLGITLIINAFILRWMIKKRNQIKEMITYGKQGTAKILKLSDTGVTINENPRVKLELEISIPNYPNYFAQKTVVIPIINIPQVQPGSIVDILADPEDKYNEDRIGLILK